MSNRWILTIATAFGIPLRIHVTFFLFFAWIVFTSGGTWEQSMMVGLLVLAIFFCVLLHELGHALTARVFSISTRDITLYPFGGIALLAKIPAAKEEFWIAVAGPAVNFAIAGMILFFDLGAVSPLVERLGHTNLFIAIFNLIPALPMDGGRIFRSILAAAGVKNATLIATRLSQGCSILLAMAGFYFSDPMLIIIAVVVSMGAVQEAVVTHTKSTIEGTLTRELMVEREKLYEFSHGTTLSDALPIALKALQDVFPVVYNEKLIGIVHRETLIDVATKDPTNQYISSLMSRTFVTVEEGSLLSDTMITAQENSLGCLPVLLDGNFTGLIFPQRVSEYMMVSSVVADSKEFHEQLDRDDPF